MALDVKKEARETISRLIQRYEQLTTAEKKNYNEANTRKNYVLPMFEALGWDIREDILEEDPAISGRVDYSFRLNHITQFLLEAKSISENLDKDEWAKQTVEYGWNRGVPWVILSDFEGLKLFNSELNTSHPRPIFDFKYTEFLDNFDKLWLLSKDSLEQNLLDKTLTGFGHGNKRIKVNDVLAADLVNWRDILTSNFKSWNPNVDKSLLNECIQRILDRLIFIRVVEDKGLEDKFLWQAFQKWQANGFKPNNFIEILIPLFRKFDQTYNSNLFIEHYCEKLDTEGDPFKTIIPDLYINKQQQVSYRFDAVNADVLGKVYEQYLGYLQKGKEDKGKRKKQGIYYTPSYIVDYIARNTIGKKLDEYSNYAEKQSIKILDPACGSGSFLINSFDYLDNYFRKLNNESITDPNIAALRKYRILSENIYGVDLDEQAVEIAKLNLLLQAVVPNFKLPLLNKHIRVGNSLIEDKNINAKAFDWKKEYSDVFDRENPGFDVIIGNPPYIKEDVNKAAFSELHNNPYYQGKMDIWTLFACNAIDLLRDNGYLSFIAPSSWVSSYGASIFREQIRRKGELVKYVDFSDFKVFPDANIQTMIFIFRKCTPQKKYTTFYTKIVKDKLDDFIIAEAINCHKSSDNAIILNAEIESEKGGNGFAFTSSKHGNLLDKIENLSNYKLDSKDIGNGIDVLQDFVNDKHLQKLGKYHFSKGDGIFVLSQDEVAKMNPDENEKKYLKPYYTSKQINRYQSVSSTNQHIIYADRYFRENINLFPNLKEHIDKFKQILTSAFAPYGLHRPRNEYFFKGNAIFTLRKTKKCAFSFVEFPCYVSRAFLIIKPRENIDLKYLVGILNSNIILYWFKNRGKKQGEQLQIDKEPLLKVPILITDENKHNELITFVEKITNDTNLFAKVSKNSDEYRKIEGEIKEIDNKINKLVYQIYGLSSDEIKEIEENLGHI